MQFLNCISILLVLLLSCSAVPLHGFKVYYTNSSKEVEAPLPESRIVNGNSAVLGQFGYQILMRSRRGLVCGGSIISRNYIVTAAHCVNNGEPDTDFYILAGTIKFDDNSATRVSVAKIIKHPNYNKPKDLDNDIALLRLSSPLTFNENISPIPLQTSEIKSGETVIVSGWGGLYQGGPIATTLQYINERTLNTDDCAKRIGNVPVGVICLEHNSDIGICGGDSGGPAVYNGKLAGVASFLINRCASNFPEGFSKISAHIDFIRQNSDVR